MSAFSCIPQDADTRLVRFGARDYDSATGRWATPDALRFKGGINIFAYGLDNPVNFADLSGMAPLGSVEISIGAQVGYSVRVGPAQLNGEINALSHTQSTAYQGGRLEQSFGGGISYAGYGVDISTGRSVSYPSESISSEPFSETSVSPSFPSGIPGSSGSVSKNQGDTVVSLGVKVGIGIEFDVNLSEAGRRLGDQFYDWFGEEPCL